MEKTVASLHDILSKGWCPSGLVTDPICWARRSHNIVADYLCNYAMDHKQNLHETFQVALPEKFHIIIHSDGGARKDCASAAWVVELTTYDQTSCQWQVQTLAYSASYFDAWTSSFTAEALALYQAVSFISIFSMQLCARGVVGKL